MNLWSFKLGINFDYTITYKMLRISKREKVCYSQFLSFIIVLTLIKLQCRYDGVN